jgi:CO/xanthine dehydrogenase FAD-binding subunit
VRAYLPAYDLHAPDTLADALSLLADNPGAWRPFAGGTDLMVLFEAGRLPEARYLGLWKLGELKGIGEDNRHRESVFGQARENRLPVSVFVGALTTYTDVLRSAELQRDFPLLCRAAAETGGIATQNRGTIGGNIANASPAADTPPALLVYDAELEITSVRGSRRVRYDRFHLGYKKMDLAADELITRIHLPTRPAGELQYYRKVGTRRAQAISKVSLAVTADVDAGSQVVRDIRIAVNSVAPTVVRCRRAEDALRGRALEASVLHAAAAALAADISPIDDIRSTARYRRRVAQQLLEECLTAFAASRPGF